MQIRVHAAGLQARGMGAAGPCSPPLYRVCVFVCMYVRALLATRSMQELDSTGKVLNAPCRLTDKGFLVGLDVERKSDGLRARIHEIKAEQVVLQMTDKTFRQACAEGFLKGLWRPAPKPKQEATSFDDWSLHAPSHSRELHAGILKGQVLQAMLVQYNELMSGVPLQVFQRPRDVVVGASYGAKQLRLPCATTRVEVAAVEEDAAGMIRIGRTQARQYTPKYPQACVTRTIEAPNPKPYKPYTGGPYKPKPTNRRTSTRSTFS